MAGAHRAIADLEGIRSMGSKEHHARVCSPRVRFVAPEADAARGGEARLLPAVSTVLAGVHAIAGSVFAGAFDT